MVYLQLRRVVVHPVQVPVAIHLEGKAVAIHSVDLNLHLPAAAVQDTHIPETLRNSSLSLLDHRINVKDHTGRLHLKDRAD
jgi:hypothetical protein